MRELKLFISGITDDLRHERQVLASTLPSLRIAGARIDTKYSDDQLSLEANLAFIYECDIFIGQYSMTRYGRIDPSAGVSVSEQEYEQARCLEKPRLVFIKQLQESDRASAPQSAFVEQIVKQGDNKLRAFEFNNPVQLEEQIADALAALIAEQFALKVTRPIFQAPSLLETFVGREPQIEKLVAALTRGQLVIIRGVGDTGGLGRSELAIHAAHLVRDQFPDGVLWANIKTTRPADTITAWARAYGGFPSLGRGDLRFEFRTLSPEERRAEEITVRADEARRVLSGKRVLAILDGAADEQDNGRIAPLLQALGDCAVMITSRTRRLQLPNAAALIELERMSETEAESLFARVLDARGVDAERSIIAEIGRSVDFLPLALNLAASLARERPTIKPQFLLESLRKERAQLESSNWGYPYLRGTRAALNMTHRFLSEDDKKFFAALGAFAGDDFDAAAAAAVTETTPYVAERTLEQLERLSFTQSRYRPGRYRLHSVLRDFARNQLTDWDAELRMAKHYCALAKTHGRKLQGSETHDAHAILDAELSNLFAGQRYAAGRNDQMGWELRRDFIHGAMTYYFNLHSMWSDWINWSFAGIEACQHLGDTSNAVAVAGSLGMVYQRKGDWDQAVEFYQNALAMLEKLENPQGMATIFMNLGVVQTQKSEWAQALSSLSRALRLNEKFGDLRGTAQTRANLGMLYAKHGERNKARGFWMQALEVFDSLGSQNEGDIVRKWLKSLPNENRK